MLQTKAFTLPKIGCQGCMKRVVTALSGLDEVEIVQTDVPTKTVMLRYDESQIGMERISGALQAIGHVMVPLDPCSAESACQ